MIITIVVSIVGIIYCFGSGFYVLYIVDTFGTWITLMTTNLINCIFFCNFLYLFLILIFIKFIFLV